MQPLTAGYGQMPTIGYPQAVTRACAASAETWLTCTYDQSPPGPVCKNYSVMNFTGARLAENADGAPPSNRWSILFVDHGDLFNCPAKSLYIQNHHRIRSIQQLRIYPVGLLMCFIRGSTQRDTNCLLVRIGKLLVISCRLRRRRITVTRFVRYYVIAIAYHKFFHAPSIYCQV